MPRGTYPRRASAAWSVLDEEADLQRHLELVDVAVSHRPTDGLDLEPIDVTHGLARPRHAVAHRLVNALGRRADDLGQPVRRVLVLGHVPSRSISAGA